MPLTGSVALMHIKLGALDIIVPTPPLSDLFPFSRSQLTFVGWLTWHVPLTRSPASDAGSTSPPP